MTNEEMAAILLCIHTLRKISTDETVPIAVKLEAGITSVVAIEFADIPASAIRETEPEPCRQFS